jgi:quinol monooxygenase YgiN
MTIEYIRYTLTAHSPESLLDAYTEACTHLVAAPECLGYDLSQCDEDPKSFVLRIHWASAEAHMRGFRQGAYFPPFLAAIREFVPEIAEMRHYSPTTLMWTR